MRHLRQVVASQMMARHRVRHDLARAWVEAMDPEEVWWRFCYYRRNAAVDWPLLLPLALALPKPAKAKSQMGETEGHESLALNAIAVRSPSGGGGGGVDLVVAIDVCRGEKVLPGERVF